MTEFDHQNPRHTGRQEGEAELVSKLHQWAIDPPAPDLLEVIVARSQNHAQIIPWPRRISSALKDSFSDWRTGFVYKVASLLICAFLGFSGGAYGPYTSGIPASQSQPAPPSPDTPRQPGSSTSAEAASAQASQSSTEDMAATDVEYLFEDIFQDLEGSLL